MKLLNNEYDKRALFKRKSKQRFQIDINEKKEKGIRKVVGRTWIALHKI